MRRKCLACSAHERTRVKDRGGLEPAVGSTERRVRSACGRRRGCSRIDVAPTPAVHRLQTKA
jgi:hypothetical protein